MTKSPDAFRTISEVAAWLETPAHVLRFWESRFPDLSPVKRAGGRRYYRPEDMQLLGGIKHLLHTEGHTIKSVQDRIKTEGTAVVIAFSPPLGLSNDPVPPAEPDAALASETISGLDADKSHLGAEPSHAEPPAARVDAKPQSDRSSAPKTPAVTDDGPPIGFFFDDSENAAPPETQSGTFASAQAETDFDTGVAPPADAEEPSAETAATDAVNPDADDDAPMGTAPVALSARLRALAPTDLSADQQARLSPLVKRLAALKSQRL